MAHRTAHARAAANVEANPAFSPKSSATAAAKRFGGEEDDATGKASIMMAQLDTDMDGAIDVSRVFHLWPDACAFGVGSGLFQGPAKNNTSDAQDDAYSVLGIPDWASKKQKLKDASRS